ncbi:MAG: phosphopyruvate hydratase [Candidatus Kerfeldbacteria bacterium]|nr:phosphopyruvate hydratase [Candidatus Kerfeldbacteria bacterium]
MTKPTIDRITATEILDSRGEPTVRATIILTDGQQASAAVPAGASTGLHEAHELRDGVGRYGGRGVLRAVEHVRTTIHQALRGMAVDQQAELDQKLVELDGTADRSHLGANAILSVSLACARTASLAHHLPLYRYLRQRYDLPESKNFPRPMCNVLNGGQHADNHISFQEFQLLPEGSTVAEQLERVAGIIRQLRQLLIKRGDRTLVGDEGGFAPLLHTNEAGLQLLGQATEAAALRLGHDVSFGLDVAASEFYESATKMYHLEPEGLRVNAANLIGLYEQLAERYPLRTLEDGLQEDDWAGWTKLTTRLGKKLLLIGDDLFVTQRDRLSQGIRAKAANAILIKPNQVGTLSETIETVKTALDDGYAPVVSHRSGETCDDFIADLAVAVGSPYLKAGSLARGERSAKYNRLLIIAAEVGA